MQSNPLWPVETRFPRLGGGLRADVLVVGGGMAGIASAYRLSLEGYDVALIEKDELGSGASGASSGVLYYGTGTNFVPAARLFGKKSARLLWRESGSAIREIVRTAKARDIPCGLRTCGAVMVAKREREAEELRAEQSGLRGAGISARLLSPEDLREIFPPRPFLRGIAFDACAQIHPAMMASGLARAAGIRVFERSPLVGWKETKDGVSARTPRARISCSKLVLATNHQPCFGLERHFRIESSVVLASAPAKDIGKVWPREKIIWSMEDRYDVLYPLGDRMALEMYDLAGSEKKLRYYYPGAGFEVRDQWGDVWAKTRDWLPIVGKVTPNILVAIGMGDQGIVTSWVAGRHMAKAVEGGRDWFLDLATPRRFDRHKGE